MGPWALLPASPFSPKKMDLQEYPQSGSTPREPSTSQYLLSVQILVRIGSFPGYDPTRPHRGQRLGIGRMLARSHTVRVDAVARSRS